MPVSGDDLEEDDDRVYLEAWNQRHREARQVNIEHPAPRTDRKLFDRFFRWGILRTLYLPVAHVRAGRFYTVTPVFTLCRPRRLAWVGKYICLRFLGV